MHAVVTHVTVNDVDAALESLRSEVVPRVSGSPGFVGGYWVRVAENKGVSVVVFESEDAARQASEQIQPPGDFVTFDSVEVGEVAASA
jgi:heme-degrading monooxygenase HmoA